MSKVTIFLQRGRKSRSTVTTEKKEVALGKGPKDKSLLSFTTSRTSIQNVYAKQSTVSLIACFIHHEPDKTFQCITLGLYSFSWGKTTRKETTATLKIFTRTLFNNWQPCVIGPAIQMVIIHLTLMANSAEFLKACF